MRVATTIPLTKADEIAAMRRTGRTPRTIAVPMLAYDATDEQWLDARRNGISASEVAAVCGHSPWDSPFSMFWRKQPNWPHREQTQEMKIGKMEEPLIAQLWADDHPQAAVYVPGARLWCAPGPYEFLSATPDYLVVWDDDPSNVEPLECKSDEGGHGWGTVESGEIPYHYRLQVWQQCFVFGAERGHVMLKKGKRTRAYVVPFGQTERETYMGLVENYLRPFMAMMATGMTPELDGHVATTETLIDLNPLDNVEGEVTVSSVLASAFVNVGKQLAELKEVYASLQNEMRAAMGRSKYALDATGNRIAERRVYKVPDTVHRAHTVDQLRKVNRSVQPVQEEDVVTNDETLSPQPGDG